MLARSETALIPYTVSHRDVKHPRLEFRTGTLLIVLPHGQDEQRVLKKHHQWIQKKYQYIQDALDTSIDIKLESRTKEEFRLLILGLINNYSSHLGCAPHRVFIKKMCTKWASCSKKDNLTINAHARYLPAYLVEYIVFHEMVHLIDSNHDDQFWKYIRKKFHHIDEIEKDLCKCWFQIQKITIS